VMFDGKIVGERTPETEEGAFGLLMAGIEDGDTIVRNGEAG
jgi:hypothetical protein